MKFLIPSAFLISLGVGCAFMVKGLIVLVLSLVLFMRAESAETLYEVSVPKFLMGTEVETMARHGDIVDCKKALVKAYQEMERVEDLLSSHMDGSEIIAIKQAAGVRPVQVSEETFEIVQRATLYGEQLDGLFDVSIGPVSALWGFSGDGNGGIPSHREIDRRLAVVNFRNVVLDADLRTVFLKEKGARMDLGAIAKGDAIDRGVSVLKDLGIKHFLLNAGGNIYVSGQKNEGMDWRVGVKHPRQVQELVAQFDLKDYAVATSGDYERFTEINGQRYQHILNPLMLSYWWPGAGREWILSILCFFIANA